MSSCQELREFPEKWRDDWKTRVDFRAVKLFSTVL